MTSPVLGGKSAFVKVAAALSALLAVGALILGLPYLFNGDAAEEGNTTWTWIMVVVGVLTLLWTYLYYKRPREILYVAGLIVVLIMLGFLTVWTWVGPILALIAIVLAVVGYTRRNRIIDRA